MALQKIAATGEKLQSIGSSIEGIVKKLVPVTSAIGGLGVVTVKIAADFGSDMSKVAGARDIFCSWLCKVVKDKIFSMREFLELAP